MYSPYLSREYCGGIGLRGSRSLESFGGVNGSYAGGVRCGSLGWLPMSNEITTCIIALSTQLKWELLGLFSPHNTAKYWSYLDSKAMRPELESNQKMTETY